MARNWTTKEIQYIKKAALLDPANSVTNLDQMANHLKRSTSAVDKRIWLMRKEGVLPAIDNSLKIFGSGRSYTDDEKKAIAKMHKQNCPIKDIAERFDRTESAISNLLERLKTNGTIKRNNSTKWTVEKTNILVNTIKFDDNGFTSNMDELRRALSVPYTTISRKIMEFRKQGIITVLPDKSKTSVASKKAHQDFNDKRFAHLGRREEPMKTETSMNVQSSKVVQVILTVVKGNDGKEVHQYFSFDGLLIAERSIEGR